jgi:hypothetical protein
MPSGKKPIANPLIVLREGFDDWAILFDPDILDDEHSMVDILLPGDFRQGIAGICGGSYV